MDAETQAKVVAEMHRDLGAAYVLIVGVLAGLPIPMLLPRDAAAEPKLAILAVSRAWELAGWEAGLSRLAVGRVRDMTLAWLTAYELVIAAGDRGPAVWRLRAFDAQILKLKAAAHYTEDYLRSRGHRPAE